ncbi:hypothetical protein HanIR_Chr11g0545161 [Helianthus annuus]|nr:hypothetical protein HanIR_Chr11g0545161 [Helianthus annuus]
MHPLHNSPSFLKLIDEDDPIFLIEMTNVYLYLRNSPKIQSRLFHRAVKLR